MLRFWLPAPPSTNNLFLTLRGGRRRVIAPKYRAWRVEADECLAKHEPIVTINDPVSIELLLDERNRMDLDNTLKAPIDALVRAGVIPTDKPKHVRRIAVAMGAAAGGCIVSVKRIAQ